MFPMHGGVVRLLSGWQWQRQRRFAAMSFGWWPINPVGLVHIRLTELPFSSAAVRLTSSVFEITLTPDLWQCGRNLKCRPVAALADGWTSDGHFTNWWARCPKWGIQLLVTTDGVTEDVRMCTDVTDVYGCHGCDRGARMAGRMGFYQTQTSQYTET